MLNSAPWPSQIPIHHSTLSPYLGIFFSGPQFLWVPNRELWVPPLKGCEKENFICKGLSGCQIPANVCYS